MSLNSRKSSASPAARKLPTASTPSSLARPRRPTVGRWASRLASSLGPAPERLALAGVEAGALLGEQAFDALRRSLAIALVDARQDRRQHALGEAVAELVERRVDQLARRGGLGLAARALRVGLAVDLVHPQALDADGARRRRIDVRRHREVHREQRLAALAARRETLEAGAVEHRLGGAGGGDQRLDARRPGAEVVEAHGDGVAELVGQLLGALEGAVDDHQRHVLARQRLAALPGHRRNADERHAAGRAPHALEQMIGGDLGERQAPLAERRVAMHLVGDAQRLFDQAPEEAPGARRPNPRRAPSRARRAAAPGSRARRPAPSRARRRRRRGARPRLRRASRAAGARPRPAAAPGRSARGRRRGGDRRRDGRLSRGRGSRRDCRSQDRRARRRPAGRRGSRPRLRALRGRR